MSEYKDLKQDLEKFNKISIDDNPVYQLHPINKDDHIIITQVGSGFKTDTKQIHVKDFKISDYNCIAVSFIYKKEDLDVNKYLNMLQIKIKKESDSIDKATFIDFFCNINEDQTIDLSSNKKLKCKYGVKVVKDNKEDIVSIYDKYPGEDKMMELLLRELLKIYQ